MFWADGERGRQGVAEGVGERVWPWLGTARVRVRVTQIFIAKIVLYMYVYAF